MAVVFVQFFEELLSMGASLVTFPSAYVTGNKVPVFAKLLECLNKETVLFVGPATPFPVVSV